MRKSWNICQVIFAVVPDTRSQLRSLRNYLNSKKEGAAMDLEANVYGEDVGKEWKHEGI